MSQAPYPGLRPFTRGEADIFFGREELTDTLVDRLEHSRFLSVVGASGCGKSSLVRAGLLDALESGFMASAGAGWQVAEMRPGGRPMLALAEALLTMSERPRYAHDGAFLQATLERHPHSLIDFLQDLPLSKDDNLLILVDQFEEIFRFAQEAYQEEAEAFIALLLAAARQRQVPIYVVLTMRSDFLGDCARFAGLPEAVNEAQFLTPRMTREQTRQAIEAPARVFGGEVEPALVNRLLNDMGTDPDQLPLMQHVLMRMWTRASTTAPIVLTLDAYKEAGGLVSALSNHADEALAELSGPQQRLAEVLFRCLSERSPAQRDTRRPVRLDAVADVAGVSLEHMRPVVEVFRRPDRNFLMPSAGTPLHADTMLDISHETLIRQWQRLNQWAEQEALSAEHYRRLEQTARLWSAGQAALWGTPDLENALAWREREGPTAAWAARYGEDFTLAMAFLDASESQRQAQQQREEEARQRELDAAHRLAEAERARAEAEAEAARLAASYAQERTQLLFESRLTHASLLARIEDYAAAQTVLQQTRELDAQVLPPAVMRVICWPVLAT